MNAQYRVRCAYFFQPHRTQTTKMASAVLLVNKEASCHPKMELSDEADSAMSSNSLHPSNIEREMEGGSVPSHEMGQVDRHAGTHQVDSHGIPISPKNEAVKKTDSPEVKIWNPLEEVDSALLSALCDSREKKGLLRLERVLVDFMKERTLGYIEVGGPLNSIVVGGQSGGASNENGDRSGQMTGISQQFVPDMQYQQQQQQQRGIRQTSFQRLILHRLADRFNIVRENITNNIAEAGPNNVNSANGNMGYGGNAAGAYPPGLIRLVKVKESCIPSNLLIDIDQSLLVNYKNPRARGGVGGTNQKSEDSLRNITESFASSTMKETPSNGGSTSKAKSKKKMVIMKRNSSGSGSSSNLEGMNGQGKRESRSRSGLKGKKLSDREKAYEEARARIFGISESTVSESNSSCNVGEKAESSDAPTADSLQENATDLERCQSSFSSVNEDTSMISAGTVENANPTREVNLTRSPSSQSERTSSSPDLQGDQQASTLDDSSRQPSLSSSNAYVPAAATSGAILKAVYRNRQQEENDPDFKRRSDVRPGYNTNAAPFVPYGGNVAHAGYMNVTMGQPPPNSVVMMQAQQTHQNHYYGQPTPILHPNNQHASHLGSPQDSTYPSNLTNPAHSPQYFASPHAYYAHTGQDAQSQSRQRPNTRQVQPKNTNGTGAKHSAQTSNSSNKQGQQDQTVQAGIGTLGRADNNVLYTPEDFPALR